MTGTESCGAGYCAGPRFGRTPGIRPFGRSLLVPILLALLLVLLPLSLSRVSAQTPVPPRPYEGGITIELWTTEDTIIHGAEAAPERRLLEEARYTLSGLIYGWDFSYTPGDARRDVPERFELEPLGLVPWGSPGLRVRDLRALEGRLHGQIDYSFSESERARLRQWESFTTGRSSGTGRGDLYAGTPGKIDAIENALHQAVRNYLRGRYPNRPREATGSIAFVRPPRIRIVSGEYEALVTIVIDLHDVRDYLVF